MTLSLQRLRETGDSFKSRIHYGANWLARYESALDEEDVNLKIVEGQLIEEVLRERGLWGQLEYYLDIGTCTGRYLLFLRGAVKKGGTIIGIDDNPECIQFAKSNIQKTCPEDARISIHRKNFAAVELVLPLTRFHLITCMMSTISHFGQDRNDGFDDLLQTALRRMADYLDENGVLIFSAWSQHACNSGNFLSIYQQQDRQRLAEWTPSEAELRMRLKNAGFTTVQMSRPSIRLNLWVCQC